MNAPTQSANEVEPERSFPGELGVWVFVLLDLAIFAAFFAMFAWDRSDDPALFNEGSNALLVSWGAVNTLLLLTGSLLVVWAVQATKERRLVEASTFINWAMVSGAVFLVNKVIEYSQKISSGHSPGESPFFTYYFCLTGLHAVHLVIGLCALVHVKRLLHEPDFGSADEVSVESVAIYWHMVDLLWIALFAILYLMM